MDLEKNEIFSLLYLTLMVRESSLKLVLMKNKIKPKNNMQAQIKMIILLVLKYTVLNPDIQQGI